MRFLPQRTDNGTQPGVAGEIHDFVQNNEFDHPVALREAVETLATDRTWDVVITQMNGVFYVRNEAGPLVKIRADLMGYTCHIVNCTKASERRDATAVERVVKARNPKSPLELVEAVQQTLTVQLPTCQLHVNPHGNVSVLKGGRTMMMWLTK